MPGGRQTGLRWVGATVLLTLRPDVVAVQPDTPEDADDALASRLDVNGDLIASGFREGGQQGPRLDDHEVRLEPEGGEPIHGLDQERAERDVRYEMAVHHVEVKNGRARALDGSDLVREAREVRRQ